MTRHLEESEMVAAIAGLELEEVARVHLKSCLVCRREVDEMEQLLAARRQEMISDEPDWDAQREAILGRLPAAPTVIPMRRRAWLRPLLAAAAVIAIAVGVATFWQGPATTTQVVELDEEAQAEAILAEVDALLSDDFLPGFEPLEEMVPTNDEFQDYFTNGAS